MYCSSDEQEMALVQTSSMLWRSRSENVVLSTKDGLEKTDNGSVVQPQY